MTGIMELKILAEFVGVDGVLARREGFVIRRNADQPRLKDFGPTLEEGKAMLQRVQAECRKPSWRENLVSGKSMICMEPIYSGLSHLI